MTEEGLNRIAGGLGITVPQAYREFMLANGSKLRETGELGNSLWATVNTVIVENLDERNPKHGTAGAYPQWWKEYFLIGRNVDCECFCLRLDGDPTVWKIGSDDSGPETVANSLVDYVAKLREPPPPLTGSAQTISTPVLRKYQVWVDHENCEVRPYGGDARTCTEQSLEEIGIDVAILKRAIARIAAALFRCDPDGIVLTLDSETTAALQYTFNGIPPLPPKERGKQLIMTAEGATLSVLPPYLGQYISRYFAIDWIELRSALHQILKVLYSPTTVAVNPSSDTWTQQIRYNIL